MKKEKSHKLRQLRKSAASMDEFTRLAADLGLTVSMGEGRRLWYQLEPRPVEKKAQDEETHM